MIAYPECYLGDAKAHLGACFDYALNGCSVDGDLFASVFAASQWGELFAQGNPFVVAGMSGAELAQRVMVDGGLRLDESGMRSPDQGTRGETRQFWAGWAVAYCQWSSVRSFSSIFSAVPFREIESMYGVYHEADVTMFAQEIDARVREKSLARPTNLHTWREACGLSQSELARAADVGLRSIQMYEQRVNNIDRAQGETLFRLAKVLGCRIDDLLEHPAQPHYDYAFVKM